MDVPDRPVDGDPLSCPERDAMVASLLGITPERLRTIRRVHHKRVGEAPARGGAAWWWQCVDQLDDDALFATFRQREIRVRRMGGAGTAAAIERRPRRSGAVRLRQPSAGA